MNKIMKVVRPEGGHRPIRGERTFVSLYSALRASIGTNVDLMSFASEVE